MGRRKKKQGTAGLVVQAVVAVVGVIALTTTAYYRWATGIQNKKGRTVVYVAPVGLLLLFAIGSGVSQEPEVETIARRETVERREAVEEVAGGSGAAFS